MSKSLRTGARRVWHSASNNPWLSGVLSGVVLLVIAAFVITPLASDESTRAGQPVASSPPRECGSIGVSVHGSAVYTGEITTRRVACNNARGYVESFLEQDVTFACQEGEYCYFRNYKCKLVSERAGRRDYRCARGPWVIRWQYPM